MKSFRMRNLFLSSLLLFCFACATNNYHKLPVERSVPFDQTGIPLLFKNSNPAPLYKANVQLYGKTFGGLLLIKNMPDSSYRIVFSTETGIKLFDFELKNDSFKVHFCIEKFNRNAVIATIASDMRLLLTETKSGQAAQELKDKNNKQRIFNFTAATGNDYYFVNSTTAQLESIEHIEQKKKKVHISLSDWNATMPKNIKIIHHNIRLKIDLILLER